MFRNPGPASALGALIIAALVPAATEGQQITGVPSVERDVARELACGPQAPLIPPAAEMKIVGGEERGKSLFASGDTVFINVGRVQGVAHGQEYFVRRVVADRFTEPFPGYHPISVHTSGWVRIVSVHTNVAVATVTHACDGISDGDYLESFVMPAAPTVTVAGEPDFGTPARVILGDERRQMAAAGGLMVLDRGSDHGLRPGQHLTIFRNTTGGPGAVARIGAATALVIRPESALIRIDRASDAIYVGDLVAIHR
jgi:hypothetical protein